MLPEGDCHTRAVGKSLCLMQICWGGGQDLFAHSGAAHSGDLQAPWRSEPKREAPGLHNELMERFPQLSRDCGDGAEGRDLPTVLAHSRNWRD